MGGNKMKSKRMKLVVDAYFRAAREWAEEAAATMGLKPGRTLLRAVKREVAPFVDLNIDQQWALPRATLARLRCMEQIEHLPTLRRSPDSLDVGLTRWVSDELQRLTAIASGRKDDLNPIH
jgi:hypothetical protein